MHVLASYGNNRVVGTHSEVVMSDNGKRTLVGKMKRTRSTFILAVVVLFAAGSANVCAQIFGDTLTGTWRSTQSGITITIQKESDVYLVHTPSGDYGGSYKDNQIQLGGIVGNVTVIRSTGEVLFGGAKFARVSQYATGLPGCDANTVAQIVRNIFQEKKVPLNNLDNMKLVRETPAEQNCQAHIETSSETATIFYKVTLEGPQYRVLITKVDASPR